jgi:hypothetical protein
VGRTFRNCRYLQSDFGCDHLGNVFEHRAHNRIATDVLISWLVIVAFES